MARKGSNIYSQHSHRSAERLADDSMAGKFINPADAHGIVPDKLRPLLNTEVLGHTDNTATDKAHSTHSEPTPAHARASHETDEAQWGSHAESWRDGKDE